MLPAELEHRAREAAAIPLLDEPDQRVAALVVDPEGIGETDWLRLHGFFVAGLVDVFPESPSHPWLLRVRRYWRNSDGKLHPGSNQEVACLIHRERALERME